jgi:hypothetical protein
MGTERTTSIEQSKRLMMGLDTDGGRKKQNKQTCKPVVLNGRGVAYITG